ncbi:MAG: carbon starvation protein A [bacterium]|nr:carbon starvation protein A [bacterium]
MLKLIFLSAMICLWIGYLFYGRFLSRFFKVDSKRQTPAHTLNDGHDYSPAKVLVLFGHSFSSIAGAGPIVGPIIACMYFGWLPALLWIIFGSIFIGGLHDFSTLIMSVRNQGKSIAEVIKLKLGHRIYLMVLVLLFFTLEYVLIVFLDLTATGFSTDGSVATASLTYIFLALVFGFFMKCKRLFLVSLPFIVILFATVYFAYLNPLFGFSKSFWQILLLIYCFTVSVLPIKVLLQPRDYLSSYMLYFALVLGVFGVFLKGDLAISYAYFIPFTERASDTLKLFPVLFITVACGAVSGFHSLVESGTISKQLDNEKDAKIIGYGGMLVEAVLAVIALVTIMILTKEEAVGLDNPIAIFSHGVGKFAVLLGVEKGFGNTLGYLIISTFLLTTLDTATRISRYIFQELFNLKTKESVYYSSFFVLILPVAFCFYDSIWKLIWPIFGATNQLVAAVGLLTVLIWQREKNRGIKFFILLPTLFMFVMSITSLLRTVLTPQLLIIKITVLGLIIITVLLVYFAIKELFYNSLFKKN